MVNDFKRNGMECFINTDTFQNIKINRMQTTKRAFRRPLQYV